MGEGTTRGRGDTEVGRRRCGEAGDGDAKTGDSESVGLNFNNCVVVGRSLSFVFYNDKYRAGSAGCVSPDIDLISGGYDEQTF